MRALRSGLIGALIGALLLVGGLFALIRLDVMPSMFGTTTSRADSRVIEALQKEEQVVLLSLGVQGIVSEEAKSRLMGVEIPGTGRSQFVQYSYRAKLGVDASKIKITKKGAKVYQVMVPDFLFIGHDKAEFKVAVEKEGVMSWVTPEVDTADMITDVLSEEGMAEQITKNRETLEDQTRTFYCGIVKGIDPEATVTFQFPEHS